MATVPARIAGMTELQGPQFQAYRGLLIGHGHAPEDPEEVLQHVRPYPGHQNEHSPYGVHWTQDEEVARKFALNPNAGGYETPKRRLDHEQPHWGVVLEGHVTTPPTGKVWDNSEVGSKHEKEIHVVAPGSGFEERYPALSSVTAHVLQSHPLSVYHDRVGDWRASGAKERGEPRPELKEFFRSQEHPVASFPIPEEHWKR